MESPENKLEYHDAQLEAPFENNLESRHFRQGLFRLAIFGMTFFSLCILGVLLWRVFEVGYPWLSVNFLTGFPSRVPARAGISSALAGSGSIILLTAMIAVILGVGAALYLEELANKTRLGKFIEINISNLAGVPSLVYGILGLAVFVRFFDFGRSILAASCTMALMILPTILIASREALRTVPPSIRLAAAALGATRWQTTWHHILPAAFPGILTGIILALSRALGEAAPLILIGGVTYIAFLPESWRDSFTTLPIQIFNWAGRPQEDFQALAAAAIIVLMVVVVVTNGLAILIRTKLENKLRW